MSKIGRNDPCPCGSGKKHKHCHGKSEQKPPVHKFAGAFPDYQNKRVYAFTKDMVFNQLDRDCRKIEKSFDSFTKKDITAASELFGLSATIIAKQVFKSLDDQSLHHTCARLIFTASQTFLASVDNARRGFRRQHCSLARDFVELLSVVLHLVSQPSALEQFYSGKLKSPKAISTAKKFLPPFGEMYGLLSNHFVHVGVGAADFDPLIEYTIDDESLGFIVPNIKIMAWLMYVVAELVFYDEIPQPRYWKQVIQNNYMYAPSAVELKWMKKFLSIK
ncbi:hypothetical protein GCM10011332_21230 [Terasakiella brassicae]|uniref:SEC-C motif-containing protein n=1 Tax=Terasakiella brassicae TaxID=1634917 RepID=A0A917FB87_9PROT|nr:SEC-C metal-binding domain-containing protein [Terasakiella brassicae]GGF66868.1 hypothetical protein GCM10011332_21230 [Terasakiella brassicae]